LSLLVPFLSPYRPVAVGAGVIAGWLVAIATASFWLRSRIGTKRWRTLQYVTFLAYFASLGHGFFAGTNHQLPLVRSAYGVSVAAVTPLTSLRIPGYRSSQRSAAKTKHTSAMPARPVAPAPTRWSPAR